MRNCKWCDAEFEGRGDYCSDKCLFENKLHLLTNDKIALEEKVRLLNIERTCVFPDMSHSLESNLQLIKLSHQKMLDEMSPECIAVYIHCQMACIEQTHEAVIRHKISKEVLKKHKDKLHLVEEQRDKETLPRQKVLKDRELWIRSWMVQNPGGLRDTAEQFFKQMQIREKAIDGFMKIPGMTREHAETMIKASEGRKQ
jgi:hypothetical protein